MSLRKKFIFILLFFSVVPLLVIGSIAAVKCKKIEEKQIGTYSIEHARIILGEINTHLYSSYTDVKNLSVFLPFMNSSEGNISDKLNVVFKGLKENKPDFYYILVADKSGDVLVSTHEEMSGENIFQAKGFQIALGGDGDIQRVGFDPLVGENCLVISVPLFKSVSSDDAGIEVIGVVSAALKCDRIREIVSGMELNYGEQDAGSHITLIDGEGMVLSCSKTDIAHNVNLIELGMVSAERVVQKKEGYLVEMTEHGSESFVAYSYLRPYRDMPDLDWGGLVYRDPEKVFTSASLLRETILYTSSITAIILFVFSFIFSDRILKPILAVSRAARDFGAGEMGRRAEVGSSDEIGELSISFNAMAEKVQDCHRKVEQEVAGRQSVEVALSQSEMKYRDLVEASQELIWQCDMKGRFTYLNPVWEQMSGYTVSESLGCLVQNFQDANSAEFDKKVIKRCLAGELFRGEETSLISKSGKEIFLLNTAKRQLDKNGNLIGIQGTAYDITDRKVAEDMMGNIIKCMSGGFALHEMVYDEDGNDIDYRYVRVNSAYMELAGVEDPTGKTVREVYPNIEQNLIDIYGEITRTGISKSFQNYHGDVGKWWQVFGFKVADNQFACVFYDITDMKKGQEMLRLEVGELEERIVARTVELSEANRKLVDQMVALRDADKAFHESEDMHRTLLGHIDLGVTLLDANHNILFVNEAQCRFFGKKEGEFIGKKCYAAFEKKGDVCIHCPGIEAMETGKTVECESEGFLDDGTAIPVKIKAFPMKTGKDGKGGGFVEVVENISDRRKAEVELEQYEEKLRGLASKLTLSEEHERHRIASGLHDSIIQPLIFLRIKLDSLVNNKTISDSKSVAVDEMRKTIADLIKMTREFTFDLSYPILYELGLETAIDEWLTEEVSGKNDIKTFFTDDGQNKQLSRDLRSFLFESFRELLVNILKHAKAKNVMVDVCSEDGIIVITVEDDGIGFDTEDRLSFVGKGSGFGLFSIRERLSYFKGSFEVMSSSGNGSKVILRAPLNKGEVD